jgi:hypothetical protein
MNSTTRRVSLLDHDVVRRRASVRSIVGRAWGRLHGALASSRVSVNTNDPEEDTDVWQQLEDDGDSGGAWREYIAIDETPSSPHRIVNRSMKSVGGSSELYEQENVDTNRQPFGTSAFSGYSSYANDSECGDGDILKRNADPEPSPVKRQASRSGGHVAFA